MQTQGKLALHEADTENDRMIEETWVPDDIIEHLIILFYGLLCLWTLVIWNNFPTPWGASHCKLVWSVIIAASHQPDTQIRNWIKVSILWANFSK